MKTKWIVAALAAMMALPFAGCDNGSSEPEEPGVVYKDGWLLAGSTVRQYRGAETSVTTPEGVTRIGEHAFENCTGITEVTIRDGVTVIDDYAFYGCENLATVSVPASVALIGSGAFSGCALDTVRYGGTIAQWCAVDGIGAVAGAEHVTMSGIEDLNGTATLEIPDGTKTIAARALYYCKDLTDVTLPASVTRIGGEAFRGYTALKELKFSGTKAQWQAIEGCDTVAVPCIQCSDGYLGVKDVPGYLKLYGTKVTGYADGLPEKLVIPDGVTEIGRGAFQDCTSLVSVEIPGSVTSIGRYAFSGCTKLKEVQFKGTKAQWQAIKGIDKVYITCIQCSDGYLGVKDAPDYLTMSGTEVTGYADGLPANLVIPDGVTGIGYDAFYGCTSLTSVTIPGSVTSIGDHAFHNCASLTSVTIGDGVAEIGDYAFYRCTSLAEVTIPATVTAIGKNAFSGCTKLREVQFKGTKAQWQAIKGSNEVYITCIQCSDGYLGVKDAPDYLTMSGTEVTGYADGLPANLVIPDGVTGIGSDAFKDCTSLTSVTIPGSVTSIGDYAFFRCTSLASVTIPDGVKTIGKRAFYNCTSLTDVTIPGNVTSIGEYAFYGCTKLREVQFKGTKAQWQAIKGIDEAYITCIQCSDGYLGVKDAPDYLTMNGTIVTGYADGLPADLVIPDGVTEIGYEAFNNCQNLTSVTIPASVKSIQVRQIWGTYSAFDRCTNLKTVTYLGTLAQWCALNGGGYLISVVDASQVTMSDGTDLKIMTNLVIPNGVERIGSGAFRGCGNLTSVTIPASVKTIGDSAFYECNGLTEVTIPEGVTEIGQYAFSSCSKLTTVAIPVSVESIGYDAFYCSSLTDVTYGGTQAQWDKIDKSWEIFPSRITTITGKDGEEINVGD